MTPAVLRQPGAGTRTVLLAALGAVCEVGLLAGLGTAGWRGADGILARSALMIALPGLAVAAWAVWMTPRSPARLGTTGRLAVQGALFLLAAAALSAVGLQAWGAGLLAAGLLDVALLARRAPGGPGAG